MARPSARFAASSWCCAAVLHCSAKRALRSTAASSRPSTRGIGTSLRPRCSGGWRRLTRASPAISRNSTAPIVRGMQYRRPKSPGSTRRLRHCARRYWTNACQGCTLKGKCTTGKERRISRWEHEAVLEAVQARLDRNPDKMRERRQTVEHPFGTIKSWMGATHFQMKTLKNVGTEMALHVLAYNMKRVISILGVGGLMEAIRA